MPTRKSDKAHRSGKPLAGVGFPFIPVPLVTLTDRKLDAIDRELLGVLNYMTIRFPRNEVRPAFDYLGRLLGLSRKTIQKHIEKLRRLGFVASSRTSNFHSTNRYTLLPLTTIYGDEAVRRSGWLPKREELPPARPYKPRNSAPHSRALDEVTRGSSPLQGTPPVRPQSFSQSPPSGGGMASTNVEAEEHDLPTEERGFMREGSACTRVALPPHPGRNGTDGKRHEGSYAIRAADSGVDEKPPSDSNGDAWQVQERRPAHALPSAVEAVEWFAGLEGWPRRFADTLILQRREWLELSPREKNVAREVVKLKRLYSLVRRWFDDMVLHGPAEEFPKLELVHVAKSEIRFLHRRAVVNLRRLDQMYTLLSMAGVEVHAPPGQRLSLEYEDAPPAPSPWFGFNPNTLVLVAGLQVKRWSIPLDS